VSDFVERFATWWSDPDPDRLGELLAEDVRLVQPLAPDTFDLAAGVAAFKRLFRFLPDLRGVVHDSSVDGNRVFIHFTLSATYGGHPIAWDGTPSIASSCARTASQPSACRSSTHSRWRSR